jgi:hypothetical protein
MSEGRPYFGMDEAALQLAVSRRTLTELIKRHPHYSWGGRKKAFYPKDIDALRLAIERQTPRAAETIRSRTHSFRNGHADYHERLVQRAKTIGAVVYFVAVANKIKIGFALDLARRLPELQMGCPDHYTIIGVMPGSQATEKALHARFIKSHYRGEWFIFTKEISDFIRENCIR